MEFDEKDNEIIQLLTKLKEAQGGYPVEMMSARRQYYVKQLVALGAGIGAAAVLKETAKAGGGSSVPPVASTLLETALIVAILVEAGAVAFINRDRVNDLFHTITTAPKVEEISTPFEIVSPPDAVIATDTALVTETATPIGTPSSLFLLATQAVGGDEDAAQANATLNGNNGNHYGQTPEPERTKKPGDNDDTKPKKNPGK